STTLIYTLSLHDALPILELLELAVKNDVRELVLTDINNTSACLNFIQYASSYGVKPIVGIDFRNGAEQQFIGIAKNNEGFRELRSEEHTSEIQSRENLV